MQEADAAGAGLGHQQDPGSPPTGALGERRSLRRIKPVRTQQGGGLVAIERQISAAEAQHTVHGEESSEAEQRHGPRYDHQGQAGGAEAEQVLEQRNHLVLAIEVVEVVQHEPDTLILQTAEQDPQRRRRCGTAIKGGARLGAVYPAPLEGLANSVEQATWIPIGGIQSVPGDRQRCGGGPGGHQRCLAGPTWRDDKRYTPASSGLIELERKPLTTEQPRTSRDGNLGAWPGSRRSLRYHRHCFQYLSQERGDLMEHPGTPCYDGAVVRVCRPKMHPAGNSHAGFHSTLDFQAASPASTPPVHLAEEKRPEL